MFFRTLFATLWAVLPLFTSTFAIRMCSTAAVLGAVITAPAYAQKSPLPNQRGTYRHLEVSFDIVGLTMDAFNYETTDVQVKFQLPDGSTMIVPAFYDGGTAWRARYTPSAPGTYQVLGVTLNGSAAGETHLQPRTWTVNGAPQPGFIRIDPKSPKRFTFDNGQRYFPIGHNVGWDEQTLIFPKMGAVGENWSRVWMAHWAGANLDWQMNEKLTPGQLSLAAARRWDAIVDTAERHGIYFQLVLQHHGQYSTSTNPNWHENPWNAENGGFLNTPEEFFTSARAKELTRRKYRYIIARWGYSPHIMAWELFNEVQWTNAMKNGKEASVVAWHNEMADFLRANDPFRHLLTTSDTTAGAGIFEKMDFLQHHDYPNDLIASAATRGTAVPSDKPQFGGEVGTGDESSDHQLRAVLYAGLMAGESGAAQPWWWDAFERNNQYSVFGSLVRFARLTNIGMHDAAKSFVVPIASKERIDLQLQPGAGWAPVKQREFTLSGSGAPAGFEHFPPYFYNQGRQDMNGGPLTFHVNNARPGSMTIHTDQISEKGAHLVVSVDGHKQAERSYPGKATKEQLAQPLSVQVPAGKHTVTVFNVGADWVHIRDFTFTGMATPLAGYGLVEPRWAALWIYQRQIFAPGAKKGYSGKVTIPGLTPGKYQATWWDTIAGAPLQTVPLIVKAGRSTILSTPLVQRDIALYIRQGK